MRVLLTRNPTATNRPDGTFGAFEVLKDNWAHVITFFSMEDDWRDNRVGESCIPAGTYRLVRTVYHKKGFETFEIAGVPGRSRCLVHPANTEEDVEGCVGIGMRFGRLKVGVDEDTGERDVMKFAVVESRKAFERFMDVMEGVDEAKITVRWTGKSPEEEPRGEPLRTT